jgi:hypothetical protein
MVAALEIPKRTELSLESLGQMLSLSLSPPLPCLVLWHSPSRAYLQSDDWTLTRWILTILTNARYHARSTSGTYAFNILRLLTCFVSVILNPFGGHRAGGSTGRLCVATAKVVLSYYCCFNTQRRNGVNWYLDGKLEFQCVEMIQTRSNALSGI